MAYDEGMDLEGADEAKVSFDSDTENDSACDMVQELVASIAREQGGTEYVEVDAQSKGNDDGFDLDDSERVNCDPQAFQWTDGPRRENHSYEY